jgi:hypothetical protein
MHARRALAVAGSQLGQEHELVIEIRANLGAAEVALGHRADGLADLRAAVALAEKLSGADSPRVASPLTSLGRALAETGDRDGARAALTRAVALAPHAAAPVAADARFALAKLTGDRALAETARADIAIDGAGPTTVLAEIDAWLAAHPR